MTVVWHLLAVTYSLRFSPVARARITRASVCASLPDPTSNGDDESVGDQLTNQLRKALSEVWAQLQSAACGRDTDLTWDVRDRGVGARGRVAGERPTAA